MPRIRLSTVGQSEPWFSGTFVGPEAGIRHPFVGPEAGMKRPVLEPDPASSRSVMSVYPLRRLSRTIPFSSWTAPFVGPVAGYRRPGPA